MPSYWINPKQFECVVQQNLAAHYDQDVSRRRLFGMLRTQLGRCSDQTQLDTLYLPDYGLDLTSLVVFDALRPLLAELLYETHSTSTGLV